MTAAPAKETCSGGTKPASLDYPRDRETFWYMSHRWLYDVDKAQMLIKAAPRSAVELDEESSRLAVKESELNEEHVKRVNPALPGIIAHVRFRAPEGELLKGHVLIDGHHRAARCQSEGAPFLAYLLTEWESLEVLLRCPEDSRPGPEEAARLRLEHEQEFATATDERDPPTGRSPA
jgi:hypothetical protein